MPSPRVVAGSTRWASPPRPETGSHPSRSEKSRISSGPSQKPGRHAPARLARRVVRSTADPGRSAAAMPRGRARPSARMNAAPASSSVAGDGARDGGAEGDRLPQVPACGAREEARVLCRERAVEAQVAAQRRHVRRCRRLAEHDLHRVARYEVQEREDERRHAEERRHEEHEAAAHERASHSIHARVRPWRSPSGDGSKPRSRRLWTTMRSSHQSGTTGRSRAARRWTRA